MPNNGWIKLHRKIKDNLVWTNDKALKIFINCLLRANHKDTTIFVGRKKVDLEKGQFVTSYPHFAEEVGYAVSTVYYWMEILEVERMIERLSKGAFTIVTVLNYNDYQEAERRVERLKKGQRKVKETDNNEEKDKKDKNIYTQEVADTFKKHIKDNAILTSSARKKIKTRLKTFSLEELKQAIVNFSNDGWQMQNNSHRPMSWFFHNDERIESYRDMKKKNKTINVDDWVIGGDNE